MCCIYYIPVLETEEREGRDLLNKYYPTPPSGHDEAYGSVMSRGQIPPILSPVEAAFASDFSGTENEGFSSQPSDTRWRVVVRESPILCPREVAASVWLRMGDSRPRWSLVQSIHLHPVNTALGYLYVHMSYLSLWCSARRRDADLRKGFTSVIQSKEEPKGPIYTGRRMKKLNI